MTVTALKMLFGDRAKLLGLVLGVAFATLLVAQQTSLFIGLMTRSQNVIAEVAAADIWVMDPLTEHVDLNRPIRDLALHKVRGVSGVEWAQPLLKGSTMVRSGRGILRNALLIGVDDASLTGLPQRFVMGSAADLRRPDAVAIDRVGYLALWPGEPLETGRELELNDRRAVVVAITDALPAFSAQAIIHTRYSQGLGYVPFSRNHLSFVLAHVAPGHAPHAVAGDISRQTGLKALAAESFSRQTVKYYLHKTGIPANFATTITLGLIVAAAIVGLVFHAFVSDSLKQFAALKVVGVDDRTIALMVLSQVGIAGAIGYAFGIGLAALFFELACGPTSALRGMILPWWVAVGTGAILVAIILVATSLSLHRVVAADPADVLRS